MVYNYFQSTHVPYIMSLSCVSNTGDTATVKLLSESTLHLLHLKLTSIFNLERGDDHSFTSLDRNDRLNIIYKDLISPEHYDGYLLKITNGIFYEFEHPHCTFINQPTFDNKITQLREESDWTLISLLSEEGLELRHNSKNKSINIKLQCIRRMQPDDNLDLSLFERQYIGIYSESRQKLRTDNLNYSCNLDNYEGLNSYLIAPNFNQIDESYITKLTFIAHEMVENEKFRFKQTKKNSNFDCTWIESTGETCAFCTEGFL
ncbi:hypothetical protein K502DRAFT_350130 [Neoconidiobolus thromboides FSU 785]|nr:hypothetical protein K502DRAFT_350130 [Neoconidiobolus thromboides FSU 785]